MGERFNKTVGQRLNSRIKVGFMALVLLPLLENRAWRKRWMLVFFSFSFFFMVFSKFSKSLGFVAEINILCGTIFFVRYILNVIVIVVARIENLSVEEVKLIYI